MRSSYMSHSTRQFRKSAEMRLLVTAAVLLAALSSLSAQEQAPSRDQIIDQAVC